MIKAVCDDLAISHITIWREEKKRRKENGNLHRILGELISYRCLGVGPLPSRLPSSPSHMGIEME